MQNTLLYPYGGDQHSHPGNLNGALKWDVELAMQYRYTAEAFSAYAQLCMFLCIYFTISLNLI